MTARFRTRLVMGLLMAAVLAVSSMTLLTPAAHALSLTTCSGTETGTYQPGLTLTPQHVQTNVNGVLGTCSSAEGITSGTYEESFPTTLSCDTALAPRTGARVLHWNSGQSSTFHFNRKINNVDGQTTVTFLGTIVSGEFAGAEAVEQVTFVTPNPLECLASPGLQQLGPGAAILTINQI
jgi:hypothetical protein